MPGPDYKPNMELESLMHRALASTAVAATPTKETVELPQYKCHKVVRAAKITQITHNEDGSAWLVFGDLAKEGEFVGELVPDWWMQKRSPHVGGYFVQYDDKYTSCSPGDAFEEGYTLLAKG